MRSTLNLVGRIFSFNVLGRMLLLKLSEFYKMERFFSVNTFIIGNALDVVREDEK
jgi:hypothetical protein